MDRDFFAELTEAWFQTNDSFPFNRTDLEEYDSESAIMIEAAWQREQTYTVLPLIHQTRLLQVSLVELLNIDQRQDYFFENHKPMI